MIKFIIILTALFFGYQTDIPIQSAPVIQEQQVNSTEEVSVKFKEKIELPDGTIDWKDTGLNQDYISKVEVQLDEYSEPYILIEFNEDGKILFEEITGRNIGNSIGIFIDDQLISSPVVHEQISGGTAKIVGRFTMEEARELAEKINSGK